MDLKHEIFERLQNKETNRWSIAEYSGRYNSMAKIWDGSLADSADTMGVQPNP